MARKSFWFYSRVAGPGKSLAAILALACSMPVQAGLLSEVIDCTRPAEKMKTNSCVQVMAEATRSEGGSFAVAESMIERRFFRESIVFLQAALEVYPSSGSLKNQLFIAKSNIDEQQALVEMNRKRDQADQQEVDFALTRIQCTRLTGAPALKACDKALALAPDDPTLIAAKGDLMAGEGMLEEAIAQYEKSLGIKPDNLILKQKIALLKGESFKAEPPREAVLASRAPDPVAAPDTPEKAASISPQSDPAKGEKKDDESKTATAPGAVDLPPGTRSVKPSDQVEVAASPAVLQDVSTPETVEEKLALLQKLKTRGLVSESEFAKRKQRLLDEALGMTMAPKSDASKIKFGRFHALVIGIDNYRYLPKLLTARKDATEIARVLEDEYGHEVKLLLDPNRDQIVEALDIYRETLGPEDNLLIFYAGHGWLDQEADQGFWLPAT